MLHLFVNDAFTYFTVAEADANFLTTCVFRGKSNQCAIMTAKRNSIAPMSLIHSVSWRLCIVQEILQCHQYGNGNQV